MYKLGQILGIFKLQKCGHKGVSNDVQEAYCEDCGAFVVNRWYLVRCKCCNIKRKAVIRNEQVTPKNNFCPNCGRKEFYVEEIENINFVDAAYAALKKEERDYSDYGFSQTQVWEDSPTSEGLRLLPLRTPS